LRRSFVTLAVVVVVALALAGCEMSGHVLSAQISDSWTHTYPLAAGGEVEVVNGNGRIEVEGVDGSTVEIRAERIARGTTDQAARDLLPRIAIKEDATPDRVSVETERLRGIWIGAGYEVRYHVRMPRAARIHARNTNGAIALTALSGRVIAETTNGGVTAKEISGGIEAHSTNGGVGVDLASLGPDKVQLRTTNGGVTLTLPESGGADLSASCTNGGISVAGVRLETTGEVSRRHLEGRINGGGTPIELRTTNGGIRVRGRSQEVQ